MSAGRGDRVWTVLELLRWTTQHFEQRGIATARLDAECLLAAALECDRLRLYIDFDKPVEEAERACFRELLKRRADERVPVAQLIGRREFWSLDLEVSSAVLTPRPETETLVEVALELAPEADGEVAVLDLGTGSGAVALALASERPKARVTATDISPEALEVARRNAERVGVTDRIRFLEGSLFAPVAGERFDLVVSNPPYLAEPGEGVAGADERAPELAHEPAQALFAGPQGTDVLHPLTAGVSDVLRTGGAVAIEVDPRQAEGVAAWLRDAGFDEIAVVRDAARRPRVVRGRLPKRGIGGGLGGELGGQGGVEAPETV